MSGRVGAPASSGAIHSATAAGYEVALEAGGGWGSRCNAGSRAGRRGELGRGSYRVGGSEISTKNRPNPDEQTADTLTRHTHSSAIEWQLRYPVRHGIKKDNVIGPGAER